jgi:hypothetical protein
MVILSLLINKLINILKAAFCLNQRVPAPFPLGAEAPDKSGVRSRPRTNPVRDRSLTTTTGSKVFKTVPVITGCATAQNACIEATRNACA